MNTASELVAGTGFVGLLVFARLLGITILLPAIAGRQISLLVRAAICVCLTMIVAPSCCDIIPPDVSGPFQSGDTATMIAMVGCEFVTGLILSLGIQILLLGVQVAGQLVSQMSGMSLGSVYDPGSGRVGNPVIRFLDLIAMAIFLLIGGHRMVISALLDTFGSWPPGTASLNAGAMDVVTGLLERSFLLGIQAAMPVLATLLVSNLMAGILGRLMPRMNVLLLSTATNSILLFASLLVGIGTVAWTLQGHLSPLVESVVRICGGA